ncbi:MAG: hypothetical protein R6U56_04915, partial [Opitutales bacterium]
ARLRGGTTHICEPRSRTGLPSDPHASQRTRAVETLAHIREASQASGRGASPLDYVVAPRTFAGPRSRTGLPSDPHAPQRTRAVETLAHIREAPQASGRGASPLDYVVARTFAGPRSRTGLPSDPHAPQRTRAVETLTHIREAPQAAGRGASPLDYGSRSAPFARCGATSVHQAS